MQSGFAVPTLKHANLNLHTKQLKTPRLKNVTTLGFYVFNPCKTYERLPSALQVRAISFSTVLKGMPKVYLFATTVPNALFPLFEAVAEVIFQASSIIE
ncbi:MAG: hypothetical protein IKB94_08630 [Clostridia bacterium]|nr:hypothetical protein [Clostridia bacterium]